MTLSVSATNLLVLNQRLQLTNKFIASAGWSEVKAMHIAHTFRQFTPTNWSFSLSLSLFLFAGHSALLFYLFSLFLFLFYRQLVILHSLSASVIDCRRLSVYCHHHLSPASPSPSPPSPPSSSSSKAAVTIRVWLVPEWCQVLECRRRRKKWLLSDRSKKIAAANYHLLFFCKK